MDMQEQSSEIAHVQTKREIQAALASAGLRPRKRFGQHFLIDGNLMRRLVESAELSSADTVLEVGPGTGGLTDLLVQQARHVLAVEIDRDLHALLENRFRTNDRFRLIQGDVLECKHRIRSDVAQLIAGAWEPRDANPAGPVKLVANLPYQIATSLIVNLLVGFPRVRRLCFTVQAELGERMTAGPSTKDYGPLSIVTQALSKVHAVSRIGPQAFWPAPTVHSVMMRVDVSGEPLRAGDEAAGFARLVRHVFEHRRKKLRSALSLALGDDAYRRVRDHVPEELRPEALSVTEWIELFRRCREAGASPRAE